MVAVRLNLNHIRFVLLGCAIAFLPVLTANAQHHEENQETNAAATSEMEEIEEQAEEFEASSFILDHIKDAHSWHLWTNKEGEHVAVPLPVILISKHSGFHAFMSSKLEHGHNHDGFILGEGMYKVLNKDGEEVEKDMSGKILEVDNSGNLVEEGLPLDFSITKNVFMMMLAVILMLWIFLSLARSYKKTGISEPKGLQGVLEPVIVFVEDDIARPNIGEGKYEKFMPYLLTVFFFILINNLMGLIPIFPFGANVTGNIAVTMVLALFTFIITQFSSNKGYWQHIFNTPGVPWWLKVPLPIMPLVEMVGIFSKPFALMIRLFANITAGHIIVLSLVSLIFIFKTLFMSPVSMFFVLFMDVMEILVAFLQAYVFTLLSALFIGLAMPEHHHEHE